MRETPAPKATTSVGIDEATRKSLQQASVDTGKSQGAIVRELVTRFVSKVKKEKS